MMSKTNRRRFLVVAGAGIALAVTAASINHLTATTGTKATSTLPPGQYEVEELRVLHEGPIPKFDQNTWTFEVYGLVKNPYTLSYEQFRKIPKAVSVSDFHCVTGWSKLGNKWEGVRFRTIIDEAEAMASSKFATIECEYGYTTSLPLEDLSMDDVILAYGLDDQELPPQLGGPLRLVVPQKYAYKSAKWVRKVKLTEEQELGYWEVRGYSNTADPFTDDRYDE